MATPKSILLMTSGLHVFGGVDTSMVAARLRSSSTAATKPGEPVHSVPSSWACAGVITRTAASVKARHNRQGRGDICLRLVGGFAVYCQQQGRCSITARGAVEEVIEL